MTKINIEEWFFSSKRWEKEHECLNMENINEKPCTYEGSLEVNITVRRSRQSGVAGATCPD